MGSLNEFGWLAEENVTSHWQATEIRYEIPHRLRLALSPRSSLGESSTPLRMTYRGEEKLPRPCKMHGRDLFGECFYAFLESNNF